MDLFVSFFAALFVGPCLVRALELFNRFAHSAGPGISFCQHGGLVLRKSGRSGGISWYGWMAILVVQLN